MHRIAFLSTAHVHTKGFLQRVADLDHAEVSVIWDDMTERGEAFAAQYQTEFTGDLAATVARDDIDGFIICAENTRHLPLLQAAVPAGKPIFCEKPLVTTGEEMRQVQALLDQHGTILLGGYFQPFSEEMQGVIALLAAGTLGKITHARYRNAHHAAYGRWFDRPEVAWFTDPVLAGGGAFMDMGTHAVHLVRTLFGPVSKVCCRLGNASGIYATVDDHGIALFVCADGTEVTVEAGWIQTGGPTGLEVTGAAGTVFKHPDRGYLVTGPDRETEQVAPAAPHPTRVERLIAAIDGSISRQELDQDLACAADAVAIMEACYASAAQAAWVDVSPV